MNWKLALIRVFINGFVIAIIALIFPNIFVPEPTLIKILIISITFGLLNAFIKPIIQFLTISFLFLTFGFVIVLVNALMLLLLDLVLPDSIFYVEGFWAAIGGGIVIGILTTLLENFLGLSPPIIDREKPQLSATGEAHIRQPAFDHLVAQLKGVKEEVKTDES